MASQKILSALPSLTFETYLEFDSTTTTCPRPGLCVIAITFSYPTHFRVKRLSGCPFSPPLSFQHFSSLTSLAADAKRTALSHSCPVIHCLSRIFHISQSPFPNSFTLLANLFVT